MTRFPFVAVNRIDVIASLAVNPRKPADTCSSGENVASSPLAPNKTDVQRPFPVIEHVESESGAGRPECYRKVLLSIAKKNLAVAAKAGEKIAYDEAPRSHLVVRIAIAREASESSRERRDRAEALNQGRIGGSLERSNVREDCDGVTRTCPKTQARHTGC